MKKKDLELETDSANLVQLYKIESDFKYREWCDKIPYIKFSSTWEVKIIPPFMGAMARFLVQKGKAKVSVYLDCHEHLGFYGGPYWEIFPVNNDTARCDINDIKKLLKYIKQSIREQSK